MYICTYAYKDSILVQMEFLEPQRDIVGWNFYTSH
jgi:hypothetical protein